MSIISALLTKLKLLRKSPQPRLVTVETTVGAMEIGETGFTPMWALCTDGLRCWLKPGYVVGSAATSTMGLKVTRTTKGFVCDLSVLPYRYQWEASCPNPTLDLPVVKVVAPVVSEEEASTERLPMRYRLFRASRPAKSPSAPVEADNRSADDGGLGFLTGLMVLGVIANSSSDD